eukprot:1102957_1
MLSLQITCCVTLIFAVFGQEDFEPCDLGYLSAYMGNNTECAYYCRDNPPSDGSIWYPDAHDPQSRSFSELKAVCHTIQAAIDHYGSTSCSSTADLVYNGVDSCCPRCPCDQDITEYHETTYFFKKECVLCQCATVNTNGDKAWSCDDLYSVSNAYEWDHFTCDSVISCTSNDNNATYLAGDVWWESGDPTWQTFCYCQYDGITYCETSYENILSSPHVALRSAFFERCRGLQGCQNDPDLLSGSTSYHHCPDCLCGSDDVTYVEYHDTDGILNTESLAISIPLSFNHWGDNYCMKCVCSGTTRDCDQYSSEPYLSGTVTCPPVPTGGQCLTGDGHSAKPKEANDGAGLIESDCYGPNTFCGWTASQWTGDSLFSDEVDFNWGCQDSIFCDTFSLTEGECYHIDIDYIVFARATFGCNIPERFAQSIGNVRIHGYLMCCRGPHCNNVEPNIASCTDNSAAQQWYDTYQQCLFGAEYETHFCEEQDASNFTCQDLQELGTWFYGCDCAALSTIYGCASTTEQQARITQEIEKKFAEMDEWSAVFGCSLYFSCDLSSGQLSVSFSGVRYSIIGLIIGITAGSIAIIAGVVTFICLVRTKRERQSE